MSRQARIQSRSGFYHVMLRGGDRQEIFFDAEDNEFFLGLLKRYKEECDFSLLAYCLMGNHVHLLLRTAEESLSRIMKKICVSYAYHFNKKYQRCGHLFQDRFKSEAIENDFYLLKALRYILQNPVKAGMCLTADGYEYSSAKAYCGVQDDLTDAGQAFEICGQEDLLHFLQEENEDICLEMDTSHHKGLTDQQAVKWVKLVLGETPDYGKENREMLAPKLRSLHNEGITIRQLSRLSGIPKGIIERCLH